MSRKSKPVRRQYELRLEVMAIIPDFYTFDWQVAAARCRNSTEVFRMDLLARAAGLTAIRQEYGRWIRTAFRKGWRVHDGVAWRCCREVTEIARIVIVEIREMSLGL